MSKKTLIPKEPVRLRARKIANGNKSLYLDINFRGRRRTESLSLYLIPERNNRDKLRNTQTINLANSIKAKRIIDIQNGDYGFKQLVQKDLNFYKFFDKIVETKKDFGSKGNWYNWKSLKEHLLSYTKTDNVVIKDINKRFCQGFLNYLKRYRKPNGEALKTNTINSYFAKFKTVLNTAEKEGLLTQNPGIAVRSPKIEQAERAYLTLSEIKALVKTDCVQPVLKRAFLFGCFTGLRFSDIKGLRWENVITNDDGSTRLVFRQKKTKGLQYLDINENAVKLLGERQDNNEVVFSGLVYSSYMTAYLKTWVAKAGINKDITFHCSRHTFAVLMLDLGTDIYTLKELLGHTEIRTTEIYAKILDKKKQNAIKLIPQILK